jgi:hypothetical protein
MEKRIGGSDRAELAASAQDVPPFALADKGIQPRLRQYGLKA